MLGLGGRRRRRQRWRRRCYEYTQHPQDYNKAKTDHDRISRDDQNNKKKRKKKLFNPSCSCRRLPRRCQNFEIFSLVLHLSKLVRCPCLLIPSPASNLFLDHSLRIDVKKKKLINALILLFQFFIARVLQSFLNIPRTPLVLLGLIIKFSAQ